MAQVLGEMEGLPELQELEGGASGGDREHEQEQFFGRLASLAARAVRSPALRRVGLAAARAALRGMGDVGGAIGGTPGTRGAALGQQIGGDVAGWLGQLLPDSELGESLPELEMESEFEQEVNPIRRWYPDVRESELEYESLGENEAELTALMEHLGHAAAEAETEAEAEQFLPALIPLAAKFLLPKAMGIGMKLLPKLGKGLLNVGKALFRSPSTRPLIRTLPTIARRTAMQLNRQARTTGQVSPAIAARVLAQQTAQVLGSPQLCVNAYRRSRASDRRFHASCACRCRPQC